MVNWTVICVDKDFRTDQPTGATYAMKVPGGMLIRVCSMIGESLAFVPDHQTSLEDATIIENTLEKWIRENKTS